MRGDVLHPPARAATGAGPLLRVQALEDRERVRQAQLDRRDSLVRHPFSLVSTPRATVAVGLVILNLTAGPANRFHRPYVLPIGLPVADPRS